jgi:hypothetical protein
MTNPSTTHELRSNPASLFVTVPNSSYYRNASYVATCNGVHVFAKTCGDGVQGGFSMSNAKIYLRLKKNSK